MTEESLDAKEVAQAGDSLEPNRTPCEVKKGHQPDHLPWVAAQLKPHDFQHKVPCPYMGDLVVCVMVTFNLLLVDTCTRFGRVTKASALARRLTWAGTLEPLVAMSWRLACLGLGRWIGPVQVHHRVTV